MTTTVQISLHDGITINAEITDYNAIDLANKLNDPKVLMVTVGDSIVNKNTVKLITPISAQ